MGDSSSGAGVTGLSSANNGVYGETTSDLINNSGVCGQDSSTSGGFGVNGESQSGVGVYGLSRGGMAATSSGVSRRRLVGMQAPAPRSRSTTSSGALSESQG